MQGNPIQTGILESTPWISDSSYWISDSLAVELGLQITIPDSLCCIPDSKAQDLDSRDMSRNARIGENGRNGN